MPILGHRTRFAILLLPPLLTSCAIGPRGITIEQREQLEIIEGYLPLPPDSVAARYQRYDPATFYSRYGRELERAARLIDSLNTGLPPERRIDTLAIDHTFENFGTAALQGRMINLSSSLFYAEEKPEVIRSIIFHEFGHRYYHLLPPRNRERLDSLWQAFRSSALFFILRDGEYSGNSRLGGHPEDGPSELFASAFNLLQNREEEVYQRIGFHPPPARALIDEIRRIVVEEKGTK